MDKKSNFYVCARCRNLIGMINSSGAVIYCCGAPMDNMQPEYTDTGAEKHQPVVNTHRGSSPCVRRSPTFSISTAA